MKTRLALSNIDAGLLYLERKNDMDQCLINYLIHEADHYAAINNFRLTHYLIRNLWNTYPSVVRSIAFHVDSLSGHKHVGEILVTIDEFRSFDDTYKYFVSSFDDLIQRRELRLYEKAVIAMKSYGGITADDYKEILYKPARNGGKRAMYTYSDILWVEKIKKVIFNDPATIVFWRDGSKTVVKAQPEEEFDPEKGLAMAIAKKALGNEGNYYNTFKKFLPKE